MTYIFSIIYRLRAARW